ncbi:hypothetical protein INR49_006941, partial [Caranx melampygus]
MRIPATLRSWLRIRHSSKKMASNSLVTSGVSAVLLPFLKKMRRWRGRDFNDTFEVLGTSRHIRAPLYTDDPLPVPERAEWPTVLGGVTCLLTCLSNCVTQSVSQPRTAAAEKDGDREEITGPDQPSSSSSSETSSLEEEEEEEEEEQQQQQQRKKRKHESTSGGWMDLAGPEEEGGFISLCETRDGGSGRWVPQGQETMSRTGPGLRSHDLGIPDARTGRSERVCVVPSARSAGGGGGGAYRSIPRGGPPKRVLRCSPGA